MKTLYTLLCAVTISGAVSAQCLTISCNNNITVPNDNTTCGAVVTYPVPTIAAYTCPSMDYDTFYYTGAQQTYVVPPGVTSVNIQTWGAQGGSNWTSNTNFGGYVSADIPVTPGSTLYVYVGGQATTTTGGFNGGGSGEGAGKGGGGGTDVRIGGTTYNDRVVVAGGGGGAGYWSSLHVVGGQGGGLTGGDGYRDPDFASNPGGKGATQSAGGPDGTCVNFNVTACAGGFGYGGSITGCGCEVYGGGGGWYGGAASGNCRGGGGGSGYAIPAATNVNMMTGVQAGNGRVVIGYNVSPTVSITQTAGLPSGSVFPVGTTTNTFMGDDGMGNTHTCSFTVTVTDGEVPVLTVPANIVTTSDAGQCGANVTWLASATDNCTATITSSSNSGDFYPVGVTTVNVTATDGAGNSDASSFTITVTDNEAPVISNVPSNITMPNDAGQCTAVVTWSAPAATDNCAATGTISHVSGSAFPVGTTTVTYIATDAQGNADTASFDVTVTDSEVPTVQCPGNITVSADQGMCSASNVQLGMISVADNCTTTVTNNAPSAFSVGTTTVTYTVTDAGGNTVTCSQDVIVTDDEAPVFGDCPQNMTACEGVVQFNTPGASDNCSAGVVQTSGPASGSTLAAGTYTVVFVATDPAMNTDTCSFTITVSAYPVVSTSNPSLVCVTDGSLTLNGSPSGGTWSGTAVSGNAFSPSGAGNGSHTLVYVFTDANGCSSFVNDTITVSPCVGISEQGGVTFTMFPNPATTAFTFTAQEQGTVELLDALGNVVLAKQVVDTQTQINIEGFAAGMYLVRFTSTSGSISTGQLQVQR
jgi:hypothetical protein